jgi:hypothetical protein
MLSISTARRGRYDPARSLDARDARERAIHDDDLRAQLHGEPRGFVSVSRLADHREFGIVLEQAAETTPHEGVVVDQENSDARGHWERYRSVVARSRRASEVGPFEDVRAEHIVQSHEEARTS